MNTNQFCSIAFSSFNFLQFDRFPSKFMKMCVVHSDQFRTFGAPVARIILKRVDEKNELKLRRFTFDKSKGLRLPCVITCIKEWQALTLVQSNLHVLLFITVLLFMLFL